METILTVKVSQLKAGDQLGNCTILENPVHILDYLGMKNKMAVKVRFKNGVESTRIWGRDTTIKLNYTRLFRNLGQQ